MRKVFTSIAVLTMVAGLAGASVAVADKVYQTERLPFSLTEAGEEAGHPDLRSGQVVNIHPNGPVVGATEQYMLNGAMPNTTYIIFLTAFVLDDDGECTNNVADPAFPMMTGTITTGPSGNGKDSFVFPAAALAPFSGATVGAQWTAVDGDGLIVYETECTIVTID